MNDDLICCPNCGHEWTPDDEPYTPPSILRNDTVWTWDAGANDYRDTGREPTRLERWAFAIEPTDTPFVSAINRTTVSPATLKAEWGWGTPE